MGPRPLAHTVLHVSLREFLQPHNDVPLAHPPESSALTAPTHRTRDSLLHLRPHGASGRPTQQRLCQTSGMPLCGRRGPR